MARFECLPPVREGDLERLSRESRRRPVLILDGVFSENRAITPAEWRMLLRKGWSLFGASSMGALRAADLWPEGMIGIGDIYIAYRTGLLRSDADVAVALDPISFAEITINLAFLRASLRTVLVRGLIDVVGARKMLKSAAKIHFMERSTQACREEWTASRFSDLAIETAIDFISDPANNPKVIDAGAALDHLLSPLWISRAERNRIRGAGETSIRRTELLMRSHTCPACSQRLSADAIFCPECASWAHENQ